MKVKTKHKVHCSFFFSSFFTVYVFIWLQQNRTEAKILYECLKFIWKVIQTKSMRRVGKWKVENNQGNKTIIKPETTVGSGT